MPRDSESAGALLELTRFDEAEFIRLTDGTEFEAVAASADLPPPQVPPDAAAIVVHDVRPKRINALEPRVRAGGSPAARFRPGADPRDLVLAATSAAEGSYDAVNIYDVGIVSWGIMQWSLHYGYLQETLAYIRAQLGRQGRQRLWSQLFPGLDVRASGSSAMLVYRGTSLPLRSGDKALLAKDRGALRKVFRGSAQRGRYDHRAKAWAQIFAFAGRHPVIQDLQRAWARRQVDRVLAIDLGRRVGNRRYRTIGAYLGRSLPGTALVFGMWTQNPGATFRHLTRAIDRLAGEYGSHDPAAWPQDAHGRLAEVFKQVLLASRFASWGTANAPKGESRTERILRSLQAVTPRMPSSAPVRREIAADARGADSAREFVGGLF